MTKLGDCAFRGCSSLANIEIPETVTEIEESAFSLCSSLDSVSIPDGVTKIADYTFNGCSSLANIIIPGNVTTIGEGAFLACDSLTSVTISEGVTTIGKNAFYHCAALTNIELPCSVTSIGTEVFEGCSSLTSVTMSEGLVSIGSYAFYECKGLACIISKETTPPWCFNQVFYNVDKSIPVYVPMASVEAYKSANGWSEFTNIIGKDFEGEETSVANVVADELVVRFDGGTLVVEGVFDYEVYSTSGINLGKPERLGSGVYIVVANGRSVKVAVK